MMHPGVLGIETSCDETAAAWLDRGTKKILASEVASQTSLHRTLGGVVPEVASREHLRVVDALVACTIEKSGKTLGEIDLVAATRGPGLSAALMVGAGFGKGLALALGVPFLGVNHLEGHLYSPFLHRQELAEQFVGLIVSGGHTMLVAVEQPGSLRVLGRTRDDAAGEAFDKVGKMLGLPYPAGPEIDRLSEGGDVRRFDLPRAMRGDGWDFSFSGLKTAARLKMADLRVEDAPDFCASFQAAVVGVLVEKAMDAVRHTGWKKLAVSGGVACNRALRSALEAACAKACVTLLLAEPWLTTDNAAMIAHAAMLAAESGVTGSVADEVDPALCLG